MTLALFDDPDAAPAPPVGARRDADFYPTPNNVWRPFVPVLQRRLSAMDESLVVEPACGDGRLLDGLLEMGIPRQRLTGVDVRAEAVEATRERGHYARHADWLDPNAADHLPNNGKGCAFVTNPPFCVAGQFALTTIRRAGPHGLVALLLRITFLEPTVERADLLAHCPADVWIPPKRGKFANGKTDTATCAWFVWPPERPGVGAIGYLGRNGGGS